MEESPWLVPVVMGVGFFAGSMYNQFFVNSTPDPEPRIMRIQANNEQLQHQLEVGQRLVAHLTLDDDKHTFRFETVDRQQKESCDGHYQVNNDVATATGKLSCVRMVALNK